MAPTRKTSRNGRDSHGSEEESSTKHVTREKRHAKTESSVHFLDMPYEVVESIFKHLPFSNIGKLRLVCRHFNNIGSSMLNAEFQRVRSSMQNRFQTIKAQMPRRESARRKHPLARESDIVETLHMRLTLLHMTFGKHIERKHCCFFAGEILDEVYKILTYIRSTPILSRAYKVTDELFDLSTMAMEYFKEHIEPTLPEITYFATDFWEYTPSLSSSPKTQLSLMDEVPPTSSTCSPAKSSSMISTLQPSVPVNPIVKKRLRKLRESVKRNNGQVLALKKELKMTQRRMTNQQKQIHEMKARYGDYDKKFQTSSRKLNAVLQELNRCKTELQYWRSKSPATHCTCGKVTPVFEFKDGDNNIFLENLEGELQLENEEEFKPIDISSDSELTTPLVVPACHGAPTESSFVHPEPSNCPLNSETSARQPSSSGCATASQETAAVCFYKPLTRSYKRKLNLDGFDDKPTANQKLKLPRTNQ